MSANNSYPPVVPDSRTYYEPIPKLYIYDHCPFCVKARMIFAMRNIKVNLIFLANDDFETPIKLVGKKVVPILEYSHGGKSVVMKESGDIIRLVDSGSEFHGKHDCSLAKGEKGDQIERLRSHQAFADLQVMCVSEQVTLPEFAFAQCRQTFIVRHPLKCGLKYGQAWTHFEEYVAQTNEILKKFAELMDSEMFVTGNSWSW